MIDGVAIFPQSTLETTSLVIVRSLLGSILATLVASLLFGLASSGWQTGGNMDWIAAYSAFVFGITPAVLFLPLVRALSLGFMVSRGYRDSLAGVIGVGAIIVAITATLGLVVLRVLPSVSSAIAVVMILVFGWLVYCLFMAVVSRRE